MSKTRSFQNIHPVTITIVIANTVTITITLQSQSPESQGTQQPTATKCDLLHGGTRSGVYSSIIASYPPYFFLRKHFAVEERKKFVSIPVMYSHHQVSNVTFLWEFNNISDCFTFLLTLGPHRARKPRRQKHTTLTSLYGVDGLAAPPQGSFYRIKINYVFHYVVI